VPEQSPGEKVQYKKSEGSWPQTRKVHPMKRPFGQSKSENFQVTCRCTWISAYWLHHCDLLAVWHSEIEFRWRLLSICKL